MFEHAVLMVPPIASVRAFHILWWDGKIKSYAPGPGCVTGVHHRKGHCTAYLCCPSWRTPQKIQPDDPYTWYFVMGCTFHIWDISHVFWFPKQGLSPSHVVATLHRPAEESSLFFRFASLQVFENDLFWARIRLGGKMQCVQTEDPGKWG